MRDIPYSLSSLILDQVRFPHHGHHKHVYVSSILQCNSIHNETNDRKKIIYLSKLVSQETTWGKDENNLSKDTTNIAFLLLLLNPLSANPTKWSNTLKHSSVTPKG